MSINLAALSFAVPGLDVFHFSRSDDQNIPWLSNISPDGGGGQNPRGPRRSPISGDALIAVGLIVFIIAGFFGLALYRAQNISNPTQARTAADATAGEVSCEELINRAMQASDDSCSQIGSNQVCYGNNTIVAELIAGAVKQFTQRGDVVNVTDLKRLAASPLRLASEEWGIAVFKVLANLPRSLPGETITMVVFGNTTLDNSSSNLQTFYFSSVLGQIECDQVPFDGLMITMPDGAGVTFIINGAEMTIMGNASLQAAQNGEMEISMFSGTASITSNGGTQIVTAGQSTSMTLGGPDGTTAISPPSPPVPLSPEGLTLACTLTGNFCSQQQITPVSPLDAVATLMAQLGLDISFDKGSGAPTATISGTPSLALTLQKTRTATSSSMQSTFALTNSLLPSLTNTPNPPTETNTQQPSSTPIPMISICHCTDPFNCNQIDIPNVGSGGHWNHAYDIIPAPAEGCPTPPPEPTPTT